METRHSSNTIRAILLEPIIPCQSSPVISAKTRSNVKDPKPVSRVILNVAFIIPTLQLARFSASVRNYFRLHVFGHRQTVLICISKAMYSWLF